MTSVGSVVRRVAVLPIRLYQLTVSPFLPPACHFHPTCSEYALQAVVAHGVLRGGCLAARRLLRCHPWSEPAIDRVPAAPR
jgi:putative membrane protein insertion efficiency factor